MSSLKLNEFGDLDFSSGGLELVTGVDETIQRLRANFRFFKGEWFLDIRIGVPFFQSVFLKNPNVIALRAIFGRIVRRDPAVVSLASLTVDLASNRRLAVTFSAQVLNDDQTIRTITITEIFIL